MRFLLLCLSLIITMPAYANERVLGLEIENMFNLIEELYNQETLDIEKISHFKELYTSSDFILKQEVVSNLGKKVIFIDQNREEFLENINKLSSKLSNSYISHTITDIRYLDDGKSAEVDYTALFKGDITKTQEDMGLVLVKFKSLNICTEFVRMENDSIKSYKSDCKIEIMYKKPEPIK